MKAYPWAWVLACFAVWCVLVWLASCTVRARVEYDLAPARSASAASAASVQ